MLCFYGYGLFTRLVPSSAHEKNRKGPQCVQINAKALPHTYLIKALKDMKKLHNPFSPGAVECLLKIIASKQVHLLNNAQPRDINEKLEKGCSNSLLG